MAECRTDASAYISYFRSHRPQGAPRRWNGPGSVSMQDGSGSCIRSGRISGYGCRNRRRHDLRKRGLVASEERGHILAPLVYDNPGPCEVAEVLALEWLSAELRVEALPVASVARAARLDAGGPGAHGSDPLPHPLYQEFQALSDLTRSGTTRGMDRPVSTSRTSSDRRGSPGIPVELFNPPEYAKRPSVMGPALDEVDRPGMVRTLRPEPNAGHLVEPEAPVLRLSQANFQPVSGMVPGTITVPCQGTTSARPASPSRPSLHHASGSRSGNSRIVQTATPAR